MPHYIYRIYNVDNPELFYIGSTSLKPKTRLSFHKARATYDCKLNKKTNKFHQTMFDMGIDSFDIRVIDKVIGITKKERKEIEDRYISDAKPPLNTRHASFDRKRNYDEHIEERRAYQRLYYRKKKQEN
jgi:hypothetical protein